jgi:hypothetical protein
MNAWTVLVKLQWKDILLDKSDCKVFGGGWNCLQLPSGAARRTYRNISSFKGYFVIVSFSLGPCGLYCLYSKEVCIGPPAARVAVPWASSWSICYSMWYLRLCIVLWVWFGVGHVPYWQQNRSPVVTVIPKGTSRSPGMNSRLRFKRLP